MSLHEIINFFCTAHISELLAQYGLWGLGAIAIIIFCETGLVVTPFLPGDSLLFTLGAFLASSTFSPLLAVIVVVIAAFTGDCVNYCIGRSPVGQWVMNRKWLKQENIAQTRYYLEKYGAATVFIGRFIPVIRTFAPFVVGMGKMPVKLFIFWNLLGGIVWSVFFITMGYLLGSMPWVKTHMELITLAIIIISITPVGYQFIRRFAK